LIYPESIPKRSLSSKIVYGRNQRLPEESQMTNEFRRPRVLVCDPIAEEGIALLREHADVEVRTGLNPEELLSIVFDFEGIIVRSRTRVDARVIRHAPRLKVIARAGAGLDNIDVGAAREKDIQVVNSPDANTLAVAEHTMGLLLALARRLMRADFSLKEGRWEKSSLMGTGLAGKTLGIIGFGRIGREVAIRARAFGMKILINQRRPTPELELAEGIRSVDLHDLLGESDFVTLHVPSRPENNLLIGEPELALMKPGAYLINTARGDILDEDALLRALDENRIMGAALDVFVEEPAVGSALAKHPKVLATPHIAASTEDAQRDAAITVAETIIEIFEGVSLENVLPLLVVPTSKVYPHEHFDRNRAMRLASRLEEDGMLSNPPITMATEKGYMVLDGATRSAALQLLDYPHIVVQVISSEDDLRLHTWYHVIRQLETGRLLSILNGLSEVVLSRVQEHKAMEELFAYGGLCLIYLADGSVYVVHPGPGQDRIEALNTLTNTYIEASHVSRTLENDLIMLKKYYEDLTALVIFPEYTVQQVMQAAAAGRMFPAGITRFIIPGRVLRVNAELPILKSRQMSLREKNSWLHNLLVDKEGRGKIRYYEEPVYLLDE
jgi:phosphoglycerate dehydrogenase-like enzyme